MFTGPENTPVHEGKKGGRKCAQRLRGGERRKIKKLLIFVHYFT